jgi:hypothetical protein
MKVVGFKDEADYFSPESGTEIIVDNLDDDKKEGDSSINKKSYAIFMTAPDEDLNVYLV